MDNTINTQMVVIPSETPTPNMTLEEVSLFNPDGSPFEGGGGLPQLGDGTFIQGDGKSFSNVAAGFADGTSTISAKANSHGNLVIGEATLGGSLEAKSDNLFLVGEAAGATGHQAE